MLLTLSSNYWSLSLMHCNLSRLFSFVPDSSSSKKEVVISLSAEETSILCYSPLALHLLPLHTPQSIQSRYANNIRIRKVQKAFIKLDDIESNHTTQAQFSILNKKCMKWMTIEFNSILYHDLFLYVCSPTVTLLLSDSEFFSNWRLQRKNCA